MPVRHDASTVSAFVETLSAFMNMRSDRHHAATKPQQQSDDPVAFRGKILCGDGLPAGIVEGLCRGELRRPFDAVFARLASEFLAWNAATAATVRGPKTPSGSPTA